MELFYRTHIGFHNFILYINIFIYEDKTKYKIKKKSEIVR